MKVITGIGFAFLLTATACKTRQVTNDYFVHGDEHAFEYPYKTVLVIGLDPVTRKRFENDVCGRLSSHGARAIRSLENWSDVEGLKREREIKGFCDRQGVPGAITIDVIDVDSEAAKSDLASVGAQSISNVIEASFSQEPQGDFLVEAIVWDTRDWEAVWVGRSEVYPARLRKKPDEVADFLVKALKDRDLVRVNRGTGR